MRTICYPKVSFNPEFRDIVMKFKRAHRMRQIGERVYMEKNIHRAESEVKGHQPQLVHLLCDAISSWRCNTLKLVVDNTVIRKVIKAYIII